MKKPYYQVYDKSDMVYYTDENDRILTPVFEYDKLFQFIRENYSESDEDFVDDDFMDGHWDEVCLKYWNEVIIKLPSSEYKSFNTPQQTKEKV